MAAAAAAPGQVPGAAAQPLTRMADDLGTAHTIISTNAALDYAAFAPYQVQKPIKNQLYHTMPAQPNGFQEPGGVNRAVNMFSDISNDAIAAVHVAGQLTHHYRMHERGSLILETFANGSNEPHMHQEQEQITLPVITTPTSVQLPSDQLTYTTDNKVAWSPALNIQGSATADELSQGTAPTTGADLVANVAASKMAGTVGSGMQAAARTPWQRLRNTAHVSRKRFQHHPYQVQSEQTTGSSLQFVLQQQQQQLRLGSSTASDVQLVTIGLQAERHEQSAADDTRIIPTGRSILEMASSYSTSAVALLDDQDQSPAAEAALTSLQRIADGDRSESAFSTVSASAAATDPYDLTTNSSSSQEAMPDSQPGDAAIAAAGVQDEAAAANAAATTEAAVGPAAATAVAVPGWNNATATSYGGSRSESSEWRPKVLDGPVPKWPRLYGTMAPPAPTLQKEMRPAAVAALIDTARAAKTPQGISICGVPGLSLEDKILLARILGHGVKGDFDAAGQLSPSSSDYWRLLEAQIEKHTPIKHMFESTYYKCGKLNADLVSRVTTADEMESEALQHILAWLGLKECQLPRPGEYATFDDLLVLLKGIGAQARMVTDPVPFMKTSEPPLGPVRRYGFLMSVHLSVLQSQCGTLH
eukprot:GHRR01011484.1.p1 GENE.GHRR01011484.1~~GHRR01011484.1.p1  ORF type:complete len:668 (+),score=259.16 GHRR01011484.1:75-2006(+)